MLSQGCFQWFCLAQGLTDTATVLIKQASFVTQRSD